MTVIAVEHLAKTYRLGQISSGTVFRDFERWLARVRGRPDPYARLGEADHGNRDGTVLWALRDVSFEVRQGEVLGIIGRNGAGKSTLLKILSRVTAPTSGQIKVRGRIASLLEVGTGFHPELTGRENIYLNGAILGMTRAEVRRKFDEIVDFAGVEPFIDTPVKRYSSGMYVRMAFAVAAHLEPEILVVDEVLAVGDAEFQQKSLGKMGEVARGGRTVLFVSHNLAAVQGLCGRALLLAHGRLVCEGATDAIVRAYLRATATAHEGRVELHTAPTRLPGSEPVLQEAWLENLAGACVASLFMGELFTLCVRFEHTQPIHAPGFVFIIENELGQRLTSFTNYIHESVDFPRSASSGTVRCAVQHNPLLPGNYYLTLFLLEANARWVDQVERVLQFKISATNLTGSGKMLRPEYGVVFLPAEVRFQQSQCS